MTNHIYDDASMQYSPALELKFVSTALAGEFRGLAAGYSRDSHNDVIQPGAFAASILAHKSSRNPVPFLLSHNQAKPIGRITSLSESLDGLVCEGAFNLATSNGTDAYHHAMSRDLTGLSIGFTIPTGGSSHARDGTRTIQRCEVKEISLCAAVKPLRREGRMLSAEPVCSCAAFSMCNCTRDRGCSAHPAFPAPSTSGVKDGATLGHLMPRECEPMSHAV
jgi:HK97 family phage prohead protease